MCALRAKSLNSLVTIRRTDERRTQPCPRDQRNGSRDLALSPPSSKPSLAFYARFKRYVSVLYVTLTFFIFRDERRQRDEYAAYVRMSRPPPSAVEEAPSRSRAVFHPSSSFHYLILWPSLAAHITIILDPHSTSVLVPPSLSSGASRSLARLC